MKIITNRDLFLSGSPYTAGKPTEASDADAALAIRHGWAAPAPAKGKKSADTAPADPGPSDPPPEEPQAGE